MMPEMDGFTLAKEIREIDRKVPILFLTAKSMKEDKLEGFAIGADDYLTKPFAMEELLARITAILRRTESPSSETSEELKVGKIKYEPELRLLHLAEGVKKLTTKENQLLQLLVKKAITLLHIYLSFYCLGNVIKSLIWNGKKPLHQYHSIHMVWVM